MIKKGTENRGEMGSWGRKGIYLVPRQSLGTDIERLCLAWRSSEAEPLNGHSQAEPGNEYFEF